jgi:hypothetical protein
MYKFPYGIVSFKKVRNKSCYYADRTEYIRTLEDTGDTIVFVRPRRFGKSLFLSMLETYYDIAEKENFEKYFGNLEIGKNPTELRNQYLILTLDFSDISASGTVKDIERSFHSRCNTCYEDFAIKYKNRLERDIEIDKEDSIGTLNHLVTSVKQAKQQLYVMIDEYDNFANALMTGQRIDEYHHIVTGEGLLKTFFKNLKSKTKTVIDKIFITGVSPVVLNDVSSGFNISRNISLYRQFHDMCGFKEEEIAKMLQDTLNEMGKPDQYAEMLDLMRFYYNGYRFCIDA